MKPFAKATIDDAAAAVEQSLLGALITSPARIGECESIAPGDFGVPEHAIIYAEIAASVERGIAVSPMTIQTALPSPHIAGVPASQYMLRMMAGSTAGVDIAGTARAIRMASDRRRIRLTAQQLIAMSESAEMSMAPEDIAQAAIAELDAITTRGVSSALRPVSISVATRQAIQSAEARARSGGLPGVTWGLTDLDDATSGMQAGDYIVLAGRPSQGKTAVALSAAASAAQAGHGVMYVSLEMTAEQLGYRMLSDLAWDPRAPVRYTDIAKLAMADADYERVLEADQKMVALQDLFIVEQQSGLTMSQIATRARNAAVAMQKAGKRLDLIVIDHMGLVRASGRYAGNKVAEIGEISNAIKPLAKELGCAVLALSQLSRASEGREDKRPTLADLRWSGEIEQDADVVIAVHREAYHLERKAEPTPEEADRLHQCRNEIELAILKQRMGPTNTVRCYCDIACNVIRDLEGRR